MATEILNPDSDLVLAKHAAEICRLGKRVVSHVIEIGRRLADAKTRVGHGNWLPWLDREFGWTEQTALNFIRAYDLSKSKNFLDLALPVSALYLLAAPSTPAEARDAVLDLAANGERLTHARVKATIAEAKPKKAARKAKRAKRAEGGRTGSVKKDPPGEIFSGVRGVGGKTRDDIGGDSTGEIARKDSRIRELENQVRRLERATAGRSAEDDGDGLGALLWAWDRAAEGAREKFKVRVGLAAAQRPTPATTGSAFPIL